MTAPRLRVAAAFGAAALLAALVVVVATPTAQQEPAGTQPEPPSPREPIPRRPLTLARVLATNTRALHAAIDGWSRRGSAPREVVLRALFHQRVHILLSERPRLARAVIRRLPRDLAGETRDIVVARRALASLAPPPRRRRYRTGPALPADALLRHYRRAERRFGVSRRVLAAVNLVETGFNRLRNRSVSGARGPMQFLPATWRSYGLGGDVDDPHDAIMGAANYLRASGAPRHYERALYAYNPARQYVDAVLRYARRMRKEPRSYYVLHSWQVFVRTPNGLRRLTGPRPR